MKTSTDVKDKDQESMDAIIRKLGSLVKERPYDISFIGVKDITVEKSIGDTFDPLFRFQIGLVFPAKLLPALGVKELKLNIGWFYHSRLGHHLRVNGALPFKELGEPISISGGTTDSIPEESLVARALRNAIDEFVPCYRALLKEAIEQLS